MQFACNTPFSFVCVWNLDIRTNIRFAIAGSCTVTDSCFGVLQFFYLNQFFSETWDFLWLIYGGCKQFAKMLCQFFTEKRFQKRGRNVKNSFWQPGECVQMSFFSLCFFKETRAFSETQHSCFSEIWPCHWNSCQRQERSVSEVQRCHGTNSRRKSNFYWKRPSSLSCCKRLSFINVRVKVFSRSCAAKALVSGCEDDYLKIFSCITPNQRCKHSCRA